MKSKLLTAAICIMVTVGGAMAQSQGTPKNSMPGKHPSMMHNKLNLTDEQKASIQKIKFDLMQKQIDIRAKIAHARLDYEQLASADSPDENAIAAKIEEISNLQVESKKNLLDNWFSVNKILTPEQQKIWKKVLQHPMMARRRMMIRMRTNGRNGPDGMMLWRRPGLGEAPSMNGGSILGEGLDDTPDVNELDDFGPMADSDIFFMNDEPFMDDLDAFDEQMNNMDMMDQGNMMERSDFLRNRMEMMKKLMNHDMPDQSTPDSLK